MARTNQPEHPPWMQNRIFEFFASLKLAVVLLAVLIVGAIVGTLYESTFDAKVARAYVYGAPWFNAWLILLGLNLTASALSRWPWKKYHSAFLITHLGIITLLIGSLIGRIFGAEGTITLFKGDPPTNRLLVDQHQLRIHDVDGIIKGFPAEFLHRPPTPQHPKDFGTLASGARLQIVDYAPAIEGSLNPRPLKEGGAPAVHFKVETAMMNQQLGSWLLADDPQHGNFSMGLANIELKRGTAPESSISKSTSTGKNGEADLEELIFAFSKAPDEQIGHVSKGGSTGAKVRLEPPSRDGGRNKGRLAISLGGKESTFDVAENLGRELKIENTPFTLKIDNYWADFRIENGKPNSIGDQPNNPAVLVTIRGKAVPVSSPETKNPHGTNEMPTTGGPPTMPAAGEAAPNHLTLFIADNGALAYELVSRKNGKSSGKIDINQSLATGWADWQLVVDKTMAYAEQWMDFTPAKSEATSMATKDLPDGVKVRVEQNGENFEQWVPAGWQISVPTSPNETMVAYGWKSVQMPIGLELIDFEVQRNEGSDSPAGFKSTLVVVNSDNQAVTGSCWMNHPFSYPGGWLHTWTGLTYKISQASWNPDNLDQSTVQILRDPGWLLKWIGSLLVVIGVFMMFYLQPYRKQTEGTPITPDGPVGDVRKPSPAPAKFSPAMKLSIFVLVSALLIGCAGDKTPAWVRFAQKQSNKWGHYSGYVEARWENDGRTMTLLSELRYTDPQGVLWIAPSGSQVDGASIPRSLWSIMGGPFEGKYRNASVLHDVAYDQKTRPHEVCDRMFYNAMRCSGVSAVEAGTMYYALRKFGHHWKAPKAEPVKVGEDIVARAEPVNQGDINATRDWIRDSGPSLQQIEQRADTQPR